MIGVKNNEQKKLVARYDGVDYTFEPGVVMAVSDEAARHIFGYGEKDKSRALLRLGWIQNGATMDSGLERLSQFQFLAAEEPRFKDEPTIELPRRVRSDERATETPLSPEEEKIGQALAKPEGPEKKFAREKK